MGSAALFYLPEPRQEHTLSAKVIHHHSNLQTKVGAKSNSPVPLMTEGEGALRLHPTGDLIARVGFYVTGSHNCTSSIPARMPRAENGHTDALSNKILL